MAERLLKLHVRTGHRLIVLMMSVAWNEEGSKTDLQAHDGMHTTASCHLQHRC